jgi:predicted O-linked N-acetylglucosamine transferase (SPINDLY family)/predicted SAM-dependent methyltransferase
MSIEERVAEGDRLRDAGSFDAAIDVYRQLLNTGEPAAQGWYKIGTTYARMQRENDAVDAYKKALDQRPDYPEAINNLALIHMARGEVDTAELYYRGMLADKPEFYEAHLNIGNLMLDTGRLAEAQYHFRRAVLLRPDSAMAHDRLGCALRNRRRVVAAIAEFERSIELDSNFFPPWNGLGTCAFDRGLHADAEFAFRRSLELHSSQSNAWHNWLFLANFQGLSNDVIWQRHRQYGQHIRTVCGALPTSFPKITPSPERRLRVGFVSGDLRRHSVAYFLESAISTVNWEEIEFWAYSTYRAEDEMTERLRPHFVQLRDLVGLTDKAAADLIRSDLIDVLIDLSGHTSHNRLPVLGYKPAPVQIAWLGYPNTTGLDCIDYRLTDTLADPEGTGDQYYSEKLWRLSGPFICYTPPSSAPTVSPSPHRLKQCITFGSFNARVKIGEDCISLWSSVLKALPESRLIIKSIIGLEEDDAKDYLLGRFVQNGIDQDRISLRGAEESLVAHLDAYGEIDIALDAFPYNGTTTTCEALWMGVPVLTMAGDRHASRVGLDLLTRLGLQEWVGLTPDEFVAKAVAFASDSELLIALRATLRDRMAASPVMGSREMGVRFQEAIRSMWKIYCEGQLRNSPVFASGEMLSGGPTDVPMRLHIGGRQVRDGWKLANVQDGPGVDYVCDVRDLSIFTDASCSEIYASHVLEHVGQRELIPTLQGLHRILVPGGKLYVSVPDLNILSWLMNKPGLEMEKSRQIMRLIFGGQMDSADFHYVGLTLDMMVGFLGAAGFASVEQVASFELFDDTSEACYLGVPISLNLVVEK